MKKFNRWVMALAVAAGIFSSTATTAFAYVPDPQQTEAATEPVSENEGTVIPEQEAAGQTEGTPQEETQGGETSFSIPGNGEVLDDKTGDGTKEFLTIQTKNGNTFFLVLDRSSNTENVYMLSMVDENDLAEFLDETKTEEAPQVVIPETEVPAESETESENGSEPVQPEEEGGRNTGALLAVGVLAAGAIGAGYYFKVVKPKKEESQEDGEDLEFYDGGTYVNEDQPEEDGSTEEENNEA